VLVFNYVKRYSMLCKLLTIVCSMSVQFIIFSLTQCEGEYSTCYLFEREYRAFF